MPAPKRQHFVVTLRDMDVTRMLPGLYQGGVQYYEKRVSEIALKGVDMAVALAPDAGVRVYAPEMVEYELEDHWRDLDHLPDLERIARMVSRRVQNGKKVAVFCRQGRNRSGLVTALSMRHLKPQWTGQKIVRHIQSRRQDALTNEAFAEYLARLPRRG